MKSNSFSDEARRYLTLFQQWAWLLALCTILAAGVAYLVSVRMTPIYRASAKVLINEAPATKSTDYSSVLTSGRLAQTYSQILITQRVLNKVIQVSDLNISVEELRDAIDVQPVRETQLIEIHFENPDPALSAKALNQLVEIFIQENQNMQANRFSESKENLSSQLEEIDLRIRQENDALNQLGDSPENTDERARLEATLTQNRQIYSSLLLSFEQVRLAEAQSISSLFPVEKARIPKDPVSPRVLLNTILAASIGFLIGFGIAFLIEALDDSLKTSEDVQKYLGLSVLGYVSHHDKQVKIVAADEPRSPVSEAFRALRTNLRFASVDRPVKSILVTSPSPADGKSTVAVNLGVVLAQLGKQVTIIDGDLRRPNVHKMMGLSNRAGVTSLFVQSDTQLAEVLLDTRVERLRILTSGEIPPNPSELLGSERFRKILASVKELSDVVIIDSPPLMAVTDSAVLAPHVDGVILVIKPGSTNLAASQEAVEQLRRVGANMLGVVLNEVDISRSRYKYYRYHGYDNSYLYSDEKDEKNGFRLKRDKAEKGA
jgi:non-specific protein-tyrosine kinase